MLLREQQWRKRLRITNKRKLPALAKAYGKSTAWEAQEAVVDMDLGRMPHMHRSNVHRLVQRHAATYPWHPYTQGHLYLIYGIALVLQGENAIFWGYSRLCHTVFPFGPDTPYDKTVLPHYVYSAASKHITVCRKLFDVTIRMRWLYIMYGQTFTSQEALCTAWDYLLIDRSHMFRLAAVLLAYAIEMDPFYVPNECGLQRFDRIVRVKVECPTVAAKLIAEAQALRV